MAYVVYGLQTLLRWFRDTFEENMAVLPTYARTLQLTMVATVMCATPPPPPSSLYQSIYEAKLSRNLHLLVYTVELLDIIWDSATIAVVAFL